MKLRFGTIPVCAIPLRFTSVTYWLYYVTPNHKWAERMAPTGATEQWKSVLVWFWTTWVCNLNIQHYYRPDISVFRTRNKWLVHAESWRRKLRSFVLNIVYQFTKKLVAAADRTITERSKRKGPTRWRPICVKYSLVTDGWKSLVESEVEKVMQRLRAKLCDICQLSNQAKNPVRSVGHRYLVGSVDDGPQ